MRGTLCHHAFAKRFRFTRRVSRRRDPGSAFLRGITRCSLARQPRPAYNNRLPAHCRYKIFGRQRMRHSQHAPSPLHCHRGSPHCIGAHIIACVTVAHARACASTQTCLVQHASYQRFLALHELVFGILPFFLGGGDCLTFAWFLGLPFFWMALTGKPKRNLPKQRRGGSLR